MLKTLRPKKAFTLLELIVVIVILGILAALAIPSFANVKAKAAEKTAISSAEGIVRDARALAAFDGVSLSDVHMDLAGAETSGYVAADDSIVVTSGGYSATAVINPLTGEITVSSSSSGGNGGGNTGTELETGTIFQSIQVGNPFGYTWLSDTTIRINNYNGGPTTFQVGDVFTFSNLARPAMCDTDPVCAPASSLTAFNASFEIIEATNSMGAVYILQMTPAAKAVSDAIAANGQTIVIAGGTGTYTVTRP